MEERNVPKQVYILTIDGGGGHKASAIALKRAIEKRGYHWQVHVVNLSKDVLATLLLKRTWWWRKINYMIVDKNCAFLIPIMSTLLKLRFHFKRKLTIEELKKYWQEKKPELVVSVVPLLNKIIYQSLQFYYPNTPFFTLITDFEERKSSFWIQNKSQYYICGTKELENRILKFGALPKKTFCVSGVIVNPNFYTKIPKKLAKEALGLDPNLTTGIVTFGGYGRAVMLDLVEHLSDQRKIQFIFVCGNNKRLEYVLKNTDTQFHKHVIGYTENMERYMQAADFFIGKPGPGSVTEAIVSRLPIIALKNQLTMFQEKCVAKWIAKQKVGLMIEDTKEIGPAIDALLAQYNHFQNNIEKLDMSAVFEVPEILHTTLQSFQESSSAKN